MRYLADENFPGQAVEMLRKRGNDVAWIRADSPGISDREVLDRAVRENRVLLTFDKDFGELTWKAGLPASCGIVLFRIPMPSPSNVGATIAALLSDQTDWTANFSVIEPDRIRMRPLPGVQ